MLVIRYDVTDDTAQDYNPEAMMTSNVWSFTLDDNEVVLWHGDFLNILSNGRSSDYSPHKVWLSLTPDQSDRLIAYTSIRAARFIANIEGY